MTTTTITDGLHPVLPIGFREDTRNPGHVNVSVFIGRNDNARGRSGTLTIRTDEWDEICDRNRRIAGASVRIEIMKSAEQEQDEVDPFAGIADVPTNDGWDG